MKTTTHFVERQHKLVLDMSRQPMRERQLVAVLAEMVVLAQHWNERKKTEGKISTTSDGEKNL